MLIDPSTERRGRLAGRRAILTGASSGVGLVAARLFAREGADLALLARGRAGLAEAERVARAEGVRAFAIPVDLGDRDATVAATHEAIERLGGLDLVVSNAAVTAFGHFAEVPAEDFDRVVAVTFGGPVDLIRTALPELRRNRGTVVSTGSLNARVPLPTFSSYAASKHALRGFLNTLRVEELEQGSGVQIAQVHPGPIDTPVFERSTSATGKRPRRPPDAYRAEVVAQALVEAAIDPVAERLVGGETRAVDAAFGPARPAVERLLMMIDRWYRTGTEDAPERGSLWAPYDHPAVSGGMPSRDSLTAWTRFGRRLLPSPSTPLKLASNLAAAGLQAAQHRGELFGGPIPERHLPVPGAEATDDATVPERGQKATQTVAQTG
jgi:NAD(P)-dependent dehydrogenase (short-subunit alcohol dehydrogenase family)